jgi:hypothetical protein
LADIAFATVFGIIISTCWCRYFIWRADGVSVRSEIAALWIGILIAAFLFALALLMIVTVYSIVYLGLWLSPVPIAVGMLVESWVSGPVNQANKIMTPATASAVAKNSHVKVRWPLRFVRGALLGIKALIWFGMLACVVVLLFNSD